MEGFGEVTVGLGAVGLGELGLFVGFGGASGFDVVGLLGGGGGFFFG